MDILTGKLFSSVDDPVQRQRLQLQILKISWMIPSIDALFKNLGYLEVCAKILKNEVLDYVPRSTIQQVISTLHTSNSSTCIVEVQEGKYATYPGESDPQVAYLQLWLFCMRHFSHLANTAPKKENGQAVPQIEESNPIYLAKLADLAYNVGIRTKKIERLRSVNADLALAKRLVTQARPAAFYNFTNSTINKLAQNIGLVLQDASTPTAQNFEQPQMTSARGESLERRYGRPFEKSYIDDQQFLFLPNMKSQNEEPIKLGQEITSFFVRCEIFASFFGLVKPLDLQKESVDTPIGDDEVGEVVCIPYKTTSILHVH